MANSDTAKTGIFNFKKYGESRWFNTLIVLLIIIGIVYMITHLITASSESGYEYVRLDKEQMQQINRIYFDTVKPKTDTAKKLNADSTRMKDSLDSIKAATVKIHITNLNSADTSKSDSLFCSGCSVTDRVICYLWNEFNHKLKPSQLHTIANYLKCASPVEASNFLGNERFEVKSYFWLTGPLVYMEIIFWSWFGVICSLLFNLGIISKNRTTNPTDPTTYFDSSEIPSQIAKLLYAPACTLIIVLGYNYFSNENLVDISSSKGVIVFAFIGGFYSSRLVAFLDKLKEILLPVSSTAGAIPKTPPLHNLVVQVELDSAYKSFWDALKTDLGSFKVTLQEENSTQQAIALNINQNQWPLFIFDYVKPGSYTLQALWTTKQDDTDINFKAEEKIVMKTNDEYKTLILNKS